MLTKGVEPCGVCPLYATHFFDKNSIWGLDRMALLKNMPDRKKERGYCFHSWRLFFNTYLLSNNVAPIKVDAVLDHSTGVSSVQEIYTNFTEADFTEIYEVQKKLFYELKYW